MKVIAAGIGDMRMQALDLGFLLLPVAAELYLFAQLALEPCQLGLIGFELLTGSNTVPSDRVASLAIPASSPTIEPDG